MKKVLLIALAAPLMLSACGGSPYRIESRDVVEPPPDVLTQERLDDIIRERHRDESRSGR
jgi:hypothetical protein